MTDSRQELQTLAPSALMVGLHQAIEGLSRGCARSEGRRALKGVSKRPLQPTLAATANAAWPSRTAALQRCTD